MACPPRFVLTKSYVDDTFSILIRITGAERSSTGYMMRGLIYFIILSCGLLPWSACSSSVKTGSGIDRTPPSNIDMVREALSRIVRTLLDSAPVDLDDHIRLVSMNSDDQQVWLVEDVLVSYLTGKNARVVVSPAHPGAHGNASAGGVEGDFEGSESLSSCNLQYRTVSIRIDYVPVKRKNPFVAKQVQRIVGVELLLRLQDRSGGEIMWARSEKGRVSDVIEQSLIPYVEGEGPFKGTMDTQEDSFFQKIWEPAFITALVLGLIYLFYANKTSD
jgi:hypothetical protein